MRLFLYVFSVALLLASSNDAWTASFPLVHKYCCGNVIFSTTDKKRCRTNSCLMRAKHDNMDEYSWRENDEDMGGESYSVGVKGDTSKDSSRTTSRWSSMNPQIKKRIIEEAQQRAIRNKQKREPVADKKRRESFHISGYYFNPNLS
jgi:hypothetical protein